jgi:hypothetical protein
MLKKMNIVIIIKENQIMLDLYMAIPECYHISFADSSNNNRLISYNEQSMNKQAQL